MSIEEIRRYVRKQPFIPFRIFVSDGHHYDVAHPDFMLIARKNVEIGIVNDPDGFPDRIISCDPLHITRIEPLSKASQRNGSKKDPK